MTQRAMSSEGRTPMAHELISQTKSTSSTKDQDTNMEILQVPRATPAYAPQPQPSIIPPSIDKKEVVVIKKPERLSKAEARKKAKFNKTFDEKGVLEMEEVILEAFKILSLEE